MKPQTGKIERYQVIEFYGIWLLGELQKQGISLSVIGENSLRVKGEMTAAQKEAIRINKRHLIEALSPKCSNCGLAMQLIDNNSIWFCPFGCSSLPSNIRTETVR